MKTDAPELAARRAAARRTAWLVAAAALLVYGAFLSTALFP